MNYGTVTFSASIATVDSGDAGPEPDIIPVTGYVKFIPSRVVTYNDTTGGLLILGPITAGIDANGVMRDPGGNDTLTLIAADSPELSHQLWSYEAYISLNNGMEVGPYPFVLHTDEAVDLGLQAPVDISNGVAILRGPRGEKGDPGDTGTGGGGAVDSVNGDTGTVVLTAADVGVVSATSSVTGLVRLAGDLAGTATAPTVPNRIAPLLNAANTDPPRPNTTATIAWLCPDTDRPATNGTTSGGAYAAAPYDLMGVWT